MSLADEDAAASSTKVKHKSLQHTGKAIITGGFRLERSEVLRSLRHYHKATVVTPSIAWRKEVWEEEALDDLPGRDEEGPSSVKVTLALF